MEEIGLMQLIAIVLGSNSIVGFIVALITVKYQKKKVQGEAHSAQYEGMKVEQDTYQELISDLKSAWKEQKWSWPHRYRRYGRKGSQRRSAHPQHP